MNENWQTANNHITYKRMKGNHWFQWEFINKYVNENNIKSILDVGCGEIKHIKGSSEWVGIDLSSAIKNKKVIHADFLNYKFDREFDMVLIAGVVNHYTNETFEKFLEAALAVNPKHIIITFFTKMMTDTSKSSKLRTSKGTYILCHFGIASIKRTLKKYNLNNYTFEKIDTKSNILIIRRDING